MPPKKARFEKKSPENIIFHDLREGNPWSEDETNDDVLKLSQPAVIVLFAPMLMHLLQYILFLSLSYVNHVYKLAQRD
jgi:hypothetical protein